MVLKSPQPSKRMCNRIITLQSIFRAMLKEATEDMPQGVTIRFRHGSIFNLSRLKASTKVTEALIRELLFADDCMMSCHTQPDLQHMTTKFSNAAKSYGLQTSITKTEVMYQPAPGKPYIYVFYSSKDRNTKSANPIKTNQKQTTLQQTKEKSGKIKINLMIARSLSNIRYKS